MSDERPDLTPVGPKLWGRGAPLPPRLAVVTVIVAVVAFLLGLELAPPRVSNPAPGPTVAVESPSALATSIALSSTPTAAPATPGSSLPAGVYHLTEREATELATAVAFYRAYDAADLPTVVELLAVQVQLFDCDYATRSAVSVGGRGAVEAYLRARIADHDNWTVEYYQENPTNGDTVVVLPLRRSSDTLRRLGAPEGVKSVFPEDFYLTFSADGRQLSGIVWNTMQGAERTLCTP